MINTVDNMNGLMKMSKHKRRRKIGLFKVGYESENWSIKRFGPYSLSRSSLFVFAQPFPCAFFRLAVGEQCGGKPQHSGCRDPAGVRERRRAAQRLIRQRLLLPPGQGGHRLLQ